MYVCNVYMHVDGHAPVCIWKPEFDIQCLPQSLFILYIEVSPSNSELDDSGSLASYLVSGNLSPPPVCHIFRWDDHAHQHLPGCWGSELWASCLYGKHFTL